MSKEYRAYAHPDLGPYYGRLRQPRTNFYRNTTSNTWELLGTSALAQYSLTATQDTSADYAYYADRPTGVTSDDDAIFELWRGSGVSPADTDQIADANYDSIVISAIDALLDAIKAKTDNLPASPAAVGSAMVLSASGLDAVLVESGISASAALTNDTGAQLTSINARQALALFAAALEGVLAGAAGTTITIKPAGKPSGNTRVTATVDSDGNRTALTLKVPD